jgi:hypothetical protein
VSALTEAFGRGWAQGQEQTRKERKQILVPAIVSLAILLRGLSDWIFPVAGLGFLAWAAFLVSAPLGLACVGLSLIAIRLLVELTGRKPRG